MKIRYLIIAACAGAFMLKAFVGDTKNLSQKSTAAQGAIGSNNYARAGSIPQPSDAKSQDVRAIKTQKAPSPQGGQTPYVSSSALTKRGY